MGKNRPKILGILLIIGAVVLGMGIFNNYDKITHQEKLSTIRVPIDIWPGNFWIAVADARGFFEEEGLKAEIVDVTEDFTQSVRDFIDGDTLDTQDIAVFDLVAENANGADLVAVLLADSSEGAEGLVAKKEYKELTDLRGKRIGVELGSYLDYFLEVAMLNSGISSAEYTKVNLVTDDMLEIFEEEELDAAFSWEPDLSKMEEEYDLKIIFDTSDIRGLSPGVFVFKREFIEKRGRDVQAFIRVWKKATDYIIENEEEVYGLVSRIDFKDSPGEYYGYDEIKELTELDPILGLEENLKAFSFDSGFESLYGNVQFVSRFIQKNQGLEDIGNTNNMLTDYFIRNLSK